MKSYDIDYSDYFWQGQKVRLRPICPKDVQKHYINSFDSPARQLLQLGIELPTSEESEQKNMEIFFGCKMHNGIILFAIETLDEEHVGGISLHSMDDKNGIFSFGIIIYKDFRKQGYAEDAVNILLKYGFLEKRYQKCNSACSESNKASIKLHLKLGFKEEGRRRRGLYFNGSYYDDILYGMTREEFDAVR